LNLTEEDKIFIKDNGLVKYKGHWVKGGTAYALPSAMAKGAEKIKMALEKWRMGGGPSDTRDDNSTDAKRILF
jgi:hypothetical protein